MKHVFLDMIDYSQDSKGKPAPFTDGCCYVITEMLEYSLKDLIKKNKSTKEPIPAGEAQHIARSITVCVAALHAKKLAHLDLKAENMMYGIDENKVGHWKMIDLDGCVATGSKIS